MKINCLNNRIEIIPESMFEQEYLKNFIFEMAYGEFIKEPDLPEVLQKLILPTKDKNVQ